MSSILRLIAVRETLERIASSGRSQPVYGFHRLGEGVIQLLSTESTWGVPLEPLGTVGPRNDASPNSVLLPLSDGDLSWQSRPDLLRPDVVEVVDVTAELATRRAGLAAVQLAEKSVVHFGTGSLGSNVALPLAQAGVRHHTLVDNTRLDPSNVSRHACGLLDLGRPKAVACADLLSLRGVAATPVVRDILSFTERELEDLVASADLAIVTTDSPAAQFTVNEACVRTGTSALFAGAWELARGGELCFYLHRKTPCYYCCVGFRAELPADLTPKVRRQAYQAADANRLEAEPGLGADIAYLSSVAAAYALALLDPTGSRTTLLEEGCSFILVHGGSEPLAQYTDIFRGPFDQLHPRVVRDEPCPVCHWSSGHGA